MLFELSPKSTDLQQQLKAFMDKHIYPNEEEYYRQLNQGDRWDIVPLIEELKEKAKAEDLWKTSWNICPEMFPRTTPAASFTDCCRNMGQLPDRIRH